MLHSGTIEQHSLVTYNTVRKACLPKMMHRTVFVNVLIMQTMMLAQIVRYNLLECRSKHV